MDTTTGLDRRDYFLRYSSGLHGIKSNIDCLRPSGKPIQRIVVDKVSTTAAIHNQAFGSHIDGPCVIDGKAGCLVEGMVFR